LAKDTTESQSKDKPSTTEVSKSVETDSSTQEITLPIEYLQVIQDTITISETIDLTQEQIYGGQQVDYLNTSSITIASLDNNSSSRWRSLQDERKRFKAPSYPR